MQKFKKLLEELQALDITQTSGDWAEDLPEGLWKEHFKEGTTEIESGLNVDKRRHYETCTTVIRVYGRLLGVTHISHTYSEQQDYESCYVKLEFCEMKEETTITYVPK